MTLEAVCFDLDDTLYPYRAYASAGLEAAGDWLEAETGEALHDELFEVYFDDEHTANTFDRVLESAGLPLELVDGMVDAFHRVESPLAPYPGTASLLEELGDRYRLGLLTDGRGGHRKLERLGLRGHFDTVLVTPTIGRSKRDPVVFDRILSELGVAPLRTAMVGDDPRVDFAIPNDHGMLTVRVCQGRHASRTPPSRDAAARYRLPDLASIPGLLETHPTTPAVGP